MFHSCQQILCVSIDATNKPLRHTPKFGRRNSPYIPLEPTKFDVCTPTIHHLYGGITQVNPYQLDQNS